MESNIIFENVKAYNVNKFDVKLLEKFTVELVNVGGESLRWFSDNDPVLSVNVLEDGKSAQIEATNIGTCEIQIQSNNTVIHRLQIEIYDHMAIALNPQVKSPILK